MNSTSTFRLQIEGMHCSACHEKITRVLENAGAHILEIDPQNRFLILQAPAGFSLEEARALLWQAGPYRPIDLIPVSRKKSSSNIAGSPRPDYPILIAALSLIAVTSFITAWEMERGKISLMHWMHAFMAGFFLVFGFFKMMDIKAFARSFSRYDLVAARWPWYGFAYPFLEVGAGWLYILIPENKILNLACLIWMIAGAAGAVRGLLRASGPPVDCACMGSRIRLPLSWITVAEYLLMASMTIPALLLD
ncbi:MAG: heavy-metal-associated domain-containing protein [Flavobacteriales bacterium]|nr:heavy-metal-associated domain-containing protein [Flavobacteriales bacterium]